MKPQTLLPCLTASVLLTAAPYGTAAGVFADLGGTGQDVAAGFADATYVNNSGAGLSSGIIVGTTTFTPAQTGFAGDVTLTISVTMSGGGTLPANQFRSVNRTLSGAPPPNSTTNDNLFKEWIGTPQLATPATDPTMTLTLTGLADGTYVWTSWHHDVSDQSGMMDYSFTDAGGTTTGNIEVSHGTNTAAGTSNQIYSAIYNPTTTATNIPSEYSTTFTVVGGSPVSFSLSPTTPPAGTVLQSRNFTVINGFSIVPEPGTLLVVAVGGLVGLLRRRR